MQHGTHNAIEDPRNKDVLIGINDELFHRGQAKISVFDSGYLVGDGVWEAFRLHNNTLCFLDEHWNRLWQNAAAIGLHLPFSRLELEQKVWKVLNANKMESGVHVRVMITRGNKKTPSQDPRLTISGPNVVIIAEHKIASEESKSKGVRLHTSSIKRGTIEFLDPKLNCHSKLHEVIALNEAIAAGCDEALMLDINNNVATCNATNFFIVKGGEVWTSTGEYCMNGITRMNVIKVCEMNNIPIYQRDFDVTSVYSADEAFVTGTFGGLTPVTEVDGKSITNKTDNNLTYRISQLYSQLIEAESNG